MLMQPKNTNDTFGDLAPWILVDMFIGAGGETRFLFCQKVFRNNTSSARLYTLQMNTI